MALDIIMFILLILAIVLVVAVSRIGLVIKDNSCEQEIKNATKNILLLRVISIFILVGIITLFFV